MRVQDHLQYAILPKELRGHRNVVKSTPKRKTEGRFRSDLARRSEDVRFIELYSVITNLPRSRHGPRLQVPSTLRTQKCLYRITALQSSTQSSEWKISILRLSISWLRSWLNLTAIADITIPQVTVVSKLISPTRMRTRSFNCSTIAIPFEDWGNRISRPYAEQSTACFVNSALSHECSRTLAAEIFRPETSV